MMVNMSWDIITTITNNCFVKSGAQGGEADITFVGQAQLPFLKPNTPNSYRTFDEIVPNGLRKFRASNKG